MDSAYAMPAFRPDDEPPPPIRIVGPGSPIRAVSYEIDVPQPGRWRVHVWPEADWEKLPPRDRPEHAFHFAERKCYVLMTFVPQAAMSLVGLVGLAG